MHVLRERLTSSFQSSYINFSTKSLTKTYTKILSEMLEYLVLNSLSLPLSSTFTYSIYPFYGVLYCLGVYFVGDERAWNGDKIVA